MFTLVGLLAGFGLIEIYRISPTLAWKQATLFGVGLALFCATILFLRDYRVLERYRYTIAIVIFLASYLNDVRDVLVRGRVPHISLKHLGPLLAIWGMAMLMLVFIRDLGSSVMFFGAFLALLYVATNRLSLVLPGLVLFLGGPAFLDKHVPHVHERVEAWLHPFRPALYNKPGGSYQIAQSLFAQADGGLFGRGFGEALLTQVGSGGKPVPIVPAAHTDLIYAVVVNEVGLFGGCAILAIGLLFAARAFKTATLATDGFAKL